MINTQQCKFIKYGYYGIAEVLSNSNANYYTASVMMQLEKGERNFVYHVKLLPRTQRKFKRFINNSRPY